ncbi:hypothetical protein Tco_1156542 [Tanacetum coccineum]
MEVLQKKTQRNLLKQQYENFTAPSSEMLDQTFDRIQKLVSQLELLGETVLQKDVNQKLLRSLSPEWNTHVVVWRNKTDLDTMSMDNLYNNLKVYEPKVKGMSSSSSSTQNMAFVSSSNNNNSSTNNGVVISFDKSKSGVLQLPYEGRILAKEGQSSKKSRLQEQGKHKKDCACGNIHFHSFGVMLENGLGGYDWSDQAEEDLIMHSHGFTHLQVLTQRFSNLKLIENQIVNNRKKGLGCNIVPPPYRRNFMPPTPGMSFTDLDEFVNKPVIKNRKSDEEVSKVVRKSDDSLIIEDWVSDREEENVSQTKTEKKTVKPGIAKIEFVKPKQQEKTVRKIVKQVKKHRQNTHSPRGNQRNWNNMMSQILGSNFKMFNKACYVCGSFDHL